MSSRDEQIAGALAPACASVGVSLYDLELRANVLRVTVERPGGLDLDTVAAASRAISEVLDADESLLSLEHYELEVTSPGLERRLRLPAHFVAAVGSLVEVRTAPGTPGERRLEATLLAADDAGVELLVGSTRRRLAYGEIERAHTLFDWRKALAGAKAVAGPETAGDELSADEFSEDELADDELDPATDEVSGGPGGPAEEIDAVREGRDRADRSGREGADEAAGAAADRTRERATQR